MGDGKFVSGPSDKWFYLIRNDLNLEGRNKNVEENDVKEREGFYAY
jgi:hypothetical protein